MALRPAHRPKPIPPPHSIWTNPIHFLACGFGFGALPLMPGTFATLAAIPLYLALYRFGILVYTCATLLALIGGVYLCHRANADFGTDDHPAAAWDEIAGLLVALFAVPPHLWTITLGVLLFRYFDIAKPGPIGWVDRHIHGGIGVILDDFLAAIATCLILHGLLWL